MSTVLQHTPCTNFPSGLQGCFKLVTPQSENRYQLKYTRARKATGMNQVYVPSLPVAWVLGVLLAYRLEIPHIAQKELNYKQHVALVLGNYMDIRYDDISCDVPPEKMQPQGLFCLPF